MSFAARVGPASLLVAALGAAPPVWAQSSSIEGVYARVIVDRTELRSGPGARFQTVRVGHRGDTFRIAQRSTLGYWFRVELPDGTFAWVHGHSVYNHRVSDEEASAGRFLPEVFAPPALPHALGELAIGFGVLGLAQPNGFMAVRPAFNLAPEFGFEMNLAGAVGAGGRLLLAAGGGLINLFPTSPIVPFMALGGGASLADPNADTFLLQSGTLGVLYGGGGLRIGFRYRITLRLEARAFAFIDENRIVLLEELSGGLTVFF